MAIDGVKFLDWTVEIVENGDTVRRLTSEIASLAKGTSFSVFGTVDRDSFIYVVQVGDRDLSILYPSDDQTDFEAAGTQLRLPQDELRFTAEIAGAIRVISAEKRISDSDWAKLFPGRDGMPQKAKKPG